MSLKGIFQIVIFAFALTIILTANGSVQAGDVAFGPNNRYWGGTFSATSCCPTSTYDYAGTVDTTYQTNYLLWVGMRSWYMPGYNFGEKYCKTNIMRYAFNASTTGSIWSYPFSASYFVTGHYFDQTIWPTGDTGLAWTSSYADNSYASWDYYLNGNGAFGISDCDDAPILQ